MNLGLGNKSRESWGNRTAFVLAAIGSAVGLGNLWGFPYKLYAFGGGAFLIPYFLAMAVMGIPLLIMEFSLGHWSQQSAPGAFAEVSGRYRYVGWWLVTLAFVIITYYTVILGYCVVFLVESLSAACTGNPLPWAGGTGAAGAHFATLIGSESYPSLGPMKWRVLAGMLTSWVLIYLCLFRGVKWVSKVVLLTVPIPWIMLVILMLRGLTLDGATTGLQFYLEPRWEKLAEVDTWRWAFGQVFFSMSLGFAVMLSYASFLHRRSDLNNNALIIGLSDLATSFFAGIAVFSTLGAMALVDNMAVDKVVSGGPSLAFVTFPYALSKLPAIPAVFSLVFFVALITLGIDSAFSIVEACLASVCDTKRKLSRHATLVAICAVGAGIGVVYCFGGGLNWLGLVDDLINGPLGILVVALAECLVVGWACKGSFVVRMREHANQRSDWKIGRWWDITIKYVAPAFLIVLIAWSVAEFVAARKWPQLIGSAVFILIPVAFYLIVSSRPQDPDTSTETIGTPDTGTAAWLLFAVPALSVLVGVVIGGVQLLRGRTEEVLPVLEEATTHFVARELGATAYAMLAIVLVVVGGGLIWCFSKAIQAAGQRDTEIN